MILRMQLINLEHFSTSQRSKEDITIFIPDIVAKELLFMKNEIMDGYEKSGLSSSTVATVKIKIRCLFLNISCYN